MRIEILSNDTCHCCKSYEDKVNRMLKEYPQYDFTLIKLNKDNYDATEKYGDKFKGLPFTGFLADDGQVIGYIMGDCKYELIQEKINDLTIKPNDRQL